MKLYNNLNRERQPFHPIDAQRVRLYVCGMTVYDFCHIGHARVLVVFDVLYRYLCRIYGASQVHYVRNITDIDDKIIQRAQENSEPFSNLTARFIDAMHEDAALLGVLPPNQEPRATLHIAEILTMIGLLLERGHAYQVDAGDVYYDVRSYPAYGRLSGKNIDELNAGERVAIADAKRDPLDFVLWKRAKPGEPSWPSPWGEGRPGWHIECSAMSTHCLGSHFDIHGGGLDLQFPHHENEIAQSCGAHPGEFVNYWIHNGFVRVDEEKMSKSLGNFFTIREVLKRYDAEVIRYFILSSHYRSPLNYSDLHLENARAALTTLYTALRGYPAAASDAEPPLNEVTQAFYSAMDDDLNTAVALSQLFELAHQINRLRAVDAAAAAAAAAQLRQLGGDLGLLQRDADLFLRGEGSSDDAEIDALVAAREQARRERNWAMADSVRDQLNARNIVVEDGVNGSRWRRG
ncbi:MAG: cysteine--tRNA ligase [Gammaproteobacteria bacterium]|nr:cysteine--tRNA ligase [Gammaproteobacteria bacterium]